MTPPKQPVQLPLRFVKPRTQTPSDAELDALAVARKWVVDGRVQF